MLLKKIYLLVGISSISLASQDMTGKEIYESFFQNYSMQAHLADQRLTRLELKRACPDLKFPVNAYNWQDREILNSQLKKPENISKSNNALLYMCQQQRNIAQRNRSKKIEQFENRLFKKLEYNYYASNPLFFDFSVFHLFENLSKKYRSA